MKTAPITANYSIDVYSPDEQGSGSFDGGKISEIKPIPFPHESGGANRTGPLLYWAWASARGDGVIGMHPHQGFEIVSYVMEGSVGHTDTAGNNRRIGAGGIQAMQTGSGISHQEEMYGDRTEFFQVWFEPDMRQSLRKAPVYSEVQESDSPIQRVNSQVSLKQIIGPNGSLQLEAPVVWNEARIQSGASYTMPLDAHSFAALVVANGSATLNIGSDERALSRRDFAMIKTSSSETLKIAAGDKGATLSVITAHSDPGYPLISF